MTYTCQGLCSNYSHCKTSFSEAKLSQEQYTISINRNWGLISLLAGGRWSFELQALYQTLCDRALEHLIKIGRYSIFKMPVQDFVHAIFFMKNISSMITNSTIILNNRWENIF